MRAASDDQPRMLFLTACANLVTMLAADDDGHVLDAKYSVEPDGNLLALILESAGGSTGGRSARNTDYRRVLDVLLTRLRDMDCTIRDGLVDSGFTQRAGIEEAQRRLIASPIRLANEPDIEAVRHNLTRPQARIGQAPGVTKGGNSSKRIRLQLDIPGYGMNDAEKLARHLAAPAPQPGLGSVDNQHRETGEDSERGDSPQPGSHRPGSRSGRIADAILRAAIEKHAVARAMEYYDNDGYEATDVGTVESYDIRAIKGTEELHVEVRGSSGTAGYVELTINEVDHAGEAPTDLIVVDQIQWERLSDGMVQTSGGRFRRWPNWRPAEADLRPSRYQYRLPHIVRTEHRVE